MIIVSLSETTVAILLCTRNFMVSVSFYSLNRSLTYDIICKCIYQLYLMSKTCCMEISKWAIVRKTLDVPF